MASEAQDLSPYANLVGQLWTAFNGSPTQTTTQTKSVDPAVQAQINSLLASLGGYSKDAAISDSSSIAAAQAKQLLEGNLGTITEAQKTSGLYGSSTAQMYTNDLISRIAANTASVQSDTVKNYASIQANMLNSASNLANAGSRTTTTTARNSAAPGTDTLGQLLGLFTAGKAAYTGGKKAYDWLSQFSGKGNVDPILQSLPPSSAGNVDSANTAIQASEGAANTGGINENIITSTSAYDSASDAAALSQGYDAYQSGSDFSSVADGYNSLGDTEMVVSESSGYGDAAASSGSMVSDAFGYGSAALNAYGTYTSGGTDYRNAVGDAILTYFGQGWAAPIANAVAPSISDAAMDFGESIGGTAGAFAAEPVGTLISGRYDTGDVINSVDPIGGSIIDAISGGGNGSVICTELLAQGLVTQEYYNKTHDGSIHIPERVLVGYRLWATPYVELMRHSKWATKLGHYLATHYLDQKLRKHNAVGALLEEFGEVICYLLSFAVKDKQAYQRLYRH